MRSHHLVLVLALSLVGCTSTGDLFGRESIDSGPLTDQFELLWEATKTTLNGMGYAVKGDSTDHADRYMESHWVEIPGTFRNQGTRTRAIVKFDETGEGDEKNLGIQVRVQKQRNENMENPLQLEIAEWAKQEPDSIRAEGIIYRVKGYFRDASPGGR
jgi:hypothetical protein